MIEENRDRKNQVVQFLPLRTPGLLCSACSLAADSQSSTCAAASLGRVLNSWQSLTVTLNFHLLSELPYFFHCMQTKITAFIFPLFVICSSQHIASCSCSQRVSMTAALHSAFWHGFCCQGRLLQPIPQWGMCSLLLLPRFCCLTLSSWVCCWDSGRAVAAHGLCAVCQSC